MTKQIVELTKLILDTELEDGYKVQITIDKSITEAYLMERKSKIDVLDSVIIENDRDIMKVVHWVKAYEKI